MVTSQAQRVRQDHRENRGFRAYQEKTESRGQKEIPVRLVQWDHQAEMLMLR